jgi:hypothetical protein
MYLDIVIRIIIGFGLSFIVFGVFVIWWNIAIEWPKQQKKMDDYEAQLGDF